jgi:L,D-peptidoglycan transpeptidase YkuD (ErfK/YbiS/YcfS/YnhG family)
MRVHCLSVVLAPLALAACRAPLATMNPVTHPLLANAGQLVVVTTPSWNDVQGSLQRFSRTSTRDAWRPEGGQVPIVVGRTGLAWGVGFDADALPGDPHKREGDGKAPAGIFPLDTLFGYAPTSAASLLRLPYVQLTNGTDCVDDTTSAHYNTVVDRSAVPMVDWNSAEHMRSVAEYEMGVIVGYNAPAPVRGRGSCIFLHIWGGPDSHTSGCTAFDRVELQRLIEWLDRARNPVMVQLPMSEYETWRARWDLPTLRARE